MTFSEIDDASVQPVAAWFYDQSSDGFAISKGGVILKVNQAWCDMLGVSREQAIGQTADDIVSSRDFENYDRAEANLRERGEDDFELEIKTTTGSAWAKVSVRRGADGYALIAARDVTEERRRTADDQAASEIHALLWSTAGVLTWTFSPALNRFHVDATRDGGIGPYVPKPGAVDFQDMLEQVDASERAGFSQALVGSADTGHPGEISFRHTSHEGRRTSFRACWRGLRREDDGRWQLAGLTQDLTELMDARDAAIAGEQLAKEADEVKSRFLANMSHEFRTPLNGVLGVLHLLKNEPLPEAAQALLDEGVKSGRTLTALLNDLLDLSHLDAGKVSLSHEVMDVTALIEELHAQYLPDLEEKGLQMQTVTLPAPLVVVIDPARLRQILAGFISNAVKFTERGGLTIRLLTFAEGDEHRLRVEVEDTGPGIAPETLRGLFVNFRQGDDATTRQFGGAGVGLALSQSLARLMGGDVGAESEVGRGSTFWVDVPAPLAEAETPGSDTPLDGLEVLVVDDNATNRLVATKILEHLGAEVDTANDGALAVAAVVDGDFDLVLMDIQMPVMDGIEATLNIRALPAPTGETPIVAMTANTSPEQIKSYEAAGMNGVIAKPVSPEAIITEIARIAGGESQASIYRLTYFSRSRTDEGLNMDQAIDDILVVAVRRNHTADVTGALLGCGGWFIQTLEGPQEAVNAVFKTILADGRHHQVIVREQGQVNQRLFPDWSMTGAQLDMSDKPIVDILGQRGFDPSGFTDEEIRALLLAVSEIRRQRPAA